MIIVCNKCGKSKSENDFSKCSSRKNGKQPNCKNCNKVTNNEWYSEIGKDYYWGNSGYFVKNKQKTKEYMKEYFAANKECIIYKLTLPNDFIYIGFTKTKLNNRILSHRNEYKKLLNGNDIQRPLPLYYFMIKNNFSNEEIDNIWKSVEILDKLAGDRKDGYTKEKEFIFAYKNKGYNLINSKHNQ